MDVAPGYLCFFFFFVVSQFGPSSGTTERGCSTKIDRCTPGHEMKSCTTKDGSAGHLCRQCSGQTFQPDYNSAIDRCRFRKACTKPFMTYKDYGSTIRDSTCKCKSGYHFESEDQRACVPNNDCDKGFGQGLYGVCEQCIKKNMYSDVKDKYQECLPLRNCEKEGRCTTKKSNGTFNNVCGPKVADVSKCENLTGGLTLQDGAMDERNIGIIAGSVVAGIFVIVFIILLFLFLRQRRRKGSQQGHIRNRPLTKEQLDRLLDRIVERAGDDDAYCKKVLSASFREIEDRIQNQIWSLAQKIYKDHYQAGMYELIVEKYKGKEHKFAINGYLQDWREWKGENADAVNYIFKCLKDCGREDIVYEICNKFREGYPEVVIDAEEQLENGVVRKRSSKSNFFERTFGFSPCTKKKNKDIEKQDNQETKDKLLALDIQSREPEQETGSLTPQEAGVIYRDRPSPSAPVIDEYGNIQSDVSFHRTLSSPVQCSS